jgi:hypothetical protein
VVLAAACCSIPTAARAASVAIELGGESVEVMASPAGVVALAGELSSLADLVIAARQRNERLARSRKISLLPNMVCVAGAFLFGFTSLVVAIVSNLGTFGSYTISTRSLHATRRSFWLRHRMPTRLDHTMLTRSLPATTLTPKPPRCLPLKTPNRTENSAHA